MGRTGSLRFIFKKDTLFVVLRIRHFEVPKRVKGWTCVMKTFWFTVILSFRCIWNLLYEVLYQFCNRQEFVDHFTGDQAYQRGYFLRNMDSDDSVNGGRVSSNDPESIASIPIGRIHNSWFKIPYHMAHIIWVISYDSYDMTVFNRIKIIFSLTFK